MKLPSRRRPPALLLLYSLAVVRNCLVVHERLCPWQHMTRGLLSCAALAVAGGDGC